MFVSELREKVVVIQDKKCNILLIWLLNFQHIVLDCILTEYQKHKHSPCSTTFSHWNDVFFPADDLIKTTTTGLTASLGFIICTDGGFPAAIFTFTDPFHLLMPWYTPSLNV